MALSRGELTLLRKACDKLNDGPDYRCKDYVANLLNTALPAAQTNQVQGETFQKESGCIIDDMLRINLGRKYLFNGW